MDPFEQFIIYFVYTCLALIIMIPIVALITGYLDYKKDIYMMKTLPNNFYTMPKLASMTIESKELKELLLNTGDNIIACGRLYDIVTKHLGAGVYKVTLKLVN